MLRQLKADDLLLVNMTKRIHFCMQIDPATFHMELIVIHNYVYTIIDETLFFVK